MSITARTKAECYYKKLSIENEKVKRKSEELIRILDLRAPAGIPAPLNSCKYMVCIHLACKLNDYPFDRSLAFKECGCNAATYREAYNVVANILHVTFPMQFEMMCKEFNCSQLAKFVKKAFARYQEIFLNSLPENKRADVHFDNPGYAAAVFLLTAEYKKVAVNKAKLIEITDCRTKDFEASYESINDLLFKPLQEMNEKSGDGKKVEVKKGEPEKKTKKKAIEKPTDSENRFKLNDILEVKDNTEILENIKLDLHLAIDLDTDKAKASKDADFQNWVKEIMAEKAQQQKQQAVPVPVPKKQSSLSNFFVAPNRKAALAEESAQLVEMIHGDGLPAELVENEPQKKRKDVGANNHDTTLTKKRKSFT